MTTQIARDHYARLAQQHRALAKNETRPDIAAAHIRFAEEHEQKVCNYDRQP